MAIIWQVNTAEVPLMMKKLNGKPLTTRPTDWCDYKPNNRIWRSRHWHHPLIATVIFWAVIWAFAIWISCR